MRLWVMSDLHVDRDVDFILPPTPPGADVLVISGDVADGWSATMRWLRETAVPRGLPMLFVAGNHDIFGADLRVGDRRQILEDAGVTLLTADQPVEISGVRFVGDTLWTDFEIAGNRPMSLRWAARSMPEFASVTYNREPLTTRHLERAHVRQLAGIEAILSRPFVGPTVVVTHHAPHPQSLLGGHVVDFTDAAFASDLTATIERWRPALWVHGHVHQSVDYVVGETRIVCNARGVTSLFVRQGEFSENDQFDPLMTVEVGP